MQGKRIFNWVIHLILVTAVAAFCFNTLLYESPWWRASLATFTLGCVMNALIGTAICRGPRQAFSIGFSISSFFYLISLYTLAGIETLPLLLTQKAYIYLKQQAASPPSEEHFYMVAILVWGLGCAYSGGLMARFWHARRMVEQANLHNHSLQATGG